MTHGRTMRAARVHEPGGTLSVDEVPVPEPDPTEVRVAVEACGVCGGDEHVIAGDPPGVEYPRIPGHEVVGRVDAVGEAVTEFDPGDRVGVGWHGGHCSTCRACRHGDNLLCSDGVVTGIHRDGGFAEYTLARREALVSVPDTFDAVETAPLLCAGLTTFNALRNSNARPGDLVAVVGVGGLGHLAVQYARQSGFETAAVSRGEAKRAAALELGADHYVDGDAEDPAEALSALGGARVVLSTAPAADAVASVTGGLGTGGQVIAVGTPGEPVPVDLGDLTGTRGAVGGWASGSPVDAEETLAFSELRDVRPRVETFGLDDVEGAYRRMLDGDVRFRAVLVPRVEAAG